MKLYRFFSFLLILSFFIISCSEKKEETKPVQLQTPQMGSGTNPLQSRAGLTSDAGVEERASANSNNIDILIETANYFDVKKDFKKAVTYYKKVLALDKNFSEAHFNLGAIYNDTKDYKNAIASYKEV